MSSIDPNPLQEFPTWRKRLYRAHWVLVALHGAGLVFLQATGGAVPVWLMGVGAVLLYVGGLLSGQADQNVYPVGPADKPFHTSN